MADEDHKPSGIAYLSLILIIIVIIAIIVVFVFVFVREDIQIPGVRLTIQTGTSTTATTTVAGTAPVATDTYETSEKDIYVSRNSTPLTLILKPGAKGEEGRIIAVKNNGVKSTDIITLQATTGLTLRDGGLGKTVSRGSTAELIAMDSSFTYLRLS